MGCCLAGGIQRFYENATNVGACVRNNVAVIKEKGQFRGVNNYRMIKELGSGSYGEVYLCRSTRSGLRGSCTTDDELYAIKILSRDTVKAAEYKCLIRVQHPNVVRLLEYIDDKSQDKVYFVLEVLGGGQIAEITGTGGLVGESWSEEHAAIFFKQMIDGLGYLHERGIIHRDIKPANFVFSSDRTIVKIIDFGESRILRGKLTDNDESRMTAGTPFFQSPEALTGDFFPDKATDVWALGVLFYLLLQGVAPFGAGSSSLFDLWRAIECEKLKHVEGVSASLSDLVSAMLSRNIAVRITLPAVSSHVFFSKDNPLLVSSHRDCSSSISAPLAQHSPGLELLQVDTALASQETDLCICKTPLTCAQQSEGSWSGLGSILDKSKPTACRILVCDDIHHDRLMLIRMMEKSAAPNSGQTVEVHEACKGEAAVSAVLSESIGGQPYDLVLVDVYLPGMTGIEVVKQIREGEDAHTLEATPILLLTTESEKPVDLAVYANQAGAQNVLIKPLHVSKVTQILEWLGIKTRVVGPEELSRPNYVAESHYVKNSLSRCKNKSALGLDLVHFDGIVEYVFDNDNSETNDECSPLSSNHSEGYQLHSTRTPAGTNSKGS